MSTRAPGTVTGQMSPVDLQENNEWRYSRKHVNRRLEQAIRDNPETWARVAQGVELLTEWREHWTAPFSDQCQSEIHHAKKSARLAQLQGLDLERLVIDIFVGTCYCRTPQLFVGVTSQLAARLGFSNHRDAIQTVAEITAVLCHTDAFDIIKESPEASMMLKSRIPLPDELIESIQLALYPLPMVCEPREIRSNFESPYLTYNECQILGRQNAHAEDICLDVLNTQNRIALQLDLDFLCRFEEAPNKALKNLQQNQQWQQFKRESYSVYQLLARQGNRFHLTNKYDKRGRLYSQGYHVHTQSTKFKKAILELAHEELIEGAPQ
jgi:hypothetical protein